MTDLLEEVLSAKPDAPLDVYCGWGLAAISRRVNQKR